MWSSNSVPTGEYLGSFYVSGSDLNRLIFSLGDFANGNERPVLLSGARIVLDNGTVTGKVPLLITHGSGGGKLMNASGRYEDPQAVIEQSLMANPLFMVGAIKEVYLLCCYVGNINITSVNGGKIKVNRVSNYQSKIILSQYDSLGDEDHQYGMIRINAYAKQAPIAMREMVNQIENSLLDMKDGLADCRQANPRMFEYATKIQNAFINYRMKHFIIGIEKDVPRDKFNSLTVFVPHPRAMQAFLFHLDFEKGKWYLTLEKKTPGSLFPEIILDKQLRSPDLEIETEIIDRAYQYWLHGDI